MRRDWTGELIEDQDLVDVHQCRRGWLDRDSARPCPTCRPWLAKRPARPPTRQELTLLRDRLARAAS